MKTVIKTPWGKIMLLQLAIAVWGTGENFKQYLIGKIMFFGGVACAIYIVVLICIDADKQDRENRRQEHEKEKEEFLNKQ